MTVRSGAGRTTVAGMMSRNDVLSVLALLREAGTDVVVAGGWGIDALLGEETRAGAHRHSRSAVLATNSANSSWNPGKVFRTQPGSS